MLTCLYLFLTKTELFLASIDWDWKTTTPRVEVSPDAKGRRTLVVQRVRDAEEEGRHIRAVGLASQGEWMQWDQALERSFSWKKLWS